ncbi:MAG: hypothetical protein Q9219_007529 [cf. Caloplaca sp. 3 TL-2023]
MGKSIKRKIPFQCKNFRGVNYAMVLKGVWALVLSPVSGVGDITCGNVVSGRFAALDGVRHIVGPCLNIIPARVRIDHQGPFPVFFQDIQRNQVAAIPYDTVPFERIARLAGWQTTARLSSIFQYQNLPESKVLDAFSGEDPSLSCTYSGAAIYGGGLLQQNTCWLMASPETDKCILPTATAELILDLADSHSTIGSRLALPFFEVRLRGHPCTPEDTLAVPDLLTYETEVPASLQAVAKQLRTLWAQALEIDVAQWISEDPIS